jgi:hypothetical protein
VARFRNHVQILERACTGLGRSSIAMGAAADQGAARQPGGWRMPAYEARGLAFLDGRRGSDCHW